LTSYTESGFTVTAATGSWFQGQLFGNPIPSIFSGPRFGSPADDSISVTEGGRAFSFSSADLAANNGDVVYTLTGTLNGGPVFNVTGTEPGHSSPFLFVTVPSGVSTDLIDGLVIAVHISGTSTNIDNIVVSTSEPMTLGMLAGALVLLALQRRLSSGRLT
jgi:hypothetical protein